MVAILTLRPSPMSSACGFFHFFACGPDSWAPAAGILVPNGFFRHGTLVERRFSPRDQLFRLPQLAYAGIRPTTGGGIANRAMRSRIVANRFRVTATSASWNVTYFECRVTLAPILINFSRRRVRDQ